MILYHYYIRDIGWSLECSLLAMKYDRINKIRRFFSDKNIEPKNYLSAIEVSFNSNTQGVKFYTLIIEDDKGILLLTIYRSCTFPLNKDIIRRLTILPNTP